MQNNETRRPLKVRTSKYSQEFARWLSKRDITPNTISAFSVVFAACSAFCLFALPYSSGSGRWLLPVLAGIFIQCRLLCNLFDGMVAVEGGKGTLSGEMFNDIPDRIADPLILVAAGYATNAGLGETSGWCAGLLAVMTAYVRTLSVSIGAPTNFCGPMAKQHRMALMTAACLFTAVDPLFWSQGYILLVGLLVVIIGSGITVYNRTRAAYIYLESNIDA